MNVQKNHRRLLAIFAACVQRMPDARLALIGVGELEKEIRALAQRLGVAQRVLFLGLRGDVNDWMQAMDVFLMPSLFEGLPVVGVEAQAAGLPCVFSDAVTQEVVLLPESCRVPLSAPDSQWAQTVERLCHEKRSRAQGASLVAQAGFDIAREARLLAQWYRTLAGRASSGME